MAVVLKLVLELIEEDLWYCYESILEAFYDSVSSH